MRARGSSVPDEEEAPAAFRGRPGTESGSHDPTTNNCTQRARSQNRRGAGLPCSDSLSTSTGSLLFPSLSVVSLDDTLSFTKQRQVGLNTNTSYIILSPPVLYLCARLLVPFAVQYLYDCAFAFACRCRRAPVFP